MSSGKRGESLQNQPSVKTGWLRKQGGVVRNWQRRWFAIKGDQLFYFKDEEEYKPLGSIFLPGNKIQELPYNIDEPGKYLFEIVSGNGGRMSTTHDTYLIQGSTKEERQEWVTTLRRVMYAHIGGGIFGQNLRETMRFEIQRNRSRKIPAISEQCVEYIKAHGLEMEGIFRLPGRQSLMNKLRNQYDCGERPDFNGQEVDVHTACSMLKMYLRELPEPIVPFSLYDDFLSLATSFRYGNTEQGLKKLEDILNSKRMPVHNYNLLKYMSEFLDLVSQNSAVNKMTMENLALIFGPNIIRGEEDSPESMMGTQNLTQHLTYVFINHHKALFKMDFSQGSYVRTDDLLKLNSNLSNKTKSTEDLVRNRIPSVVRELEDLDFSTSAAQGSTITDASENNGDVSPDVIHSAPLMSNSIKSVDSGLEDSADSVTIPQMRERRNSIGDSRPSSRTSTVNGPPVAPPRKSVSLKLPPKSDRRRQGLIDSLQHAVSDEDFSFDDMPETVPELQSMVKNLRLQMCSSKARYKCKLNEMAKRLNMQQEATDQAVSRVVNLQTQLQEYMLKYGPLE